MEVSPSDRDEVWTPLRVLNWAVPFLKGKGVESPRLDVECLLARVLGCDRLRVYLQFDRPLSADERATLRDWIARRARREPLAYLLGEKEFYGLPFIVNRSVLIPRPESEMLVEEAKKVLEVLPPEERTLLDLGTGSGCLALSLAAALPDLRVWALDQSGDALATARQNAQRHGLEDRVVFRQGSWWEALLPPDPTQFAVIISNPPYISEGERGEIAPEILEYEPFVALFSGESGLVDYQAIGMGLEARLAPGGWAFLELNSNLSDKIEALWAHWEGRRVLRDLQGLPRVLALQKQPIA